MIERPSPVPLPAELLAQRSLWISARAVQRDGRRAREYELRSADGTLALTAVSFLWGRDIVVHEPEGAEVLRLGRRRLFPLTGRVDVTGASGMALGAVFRNGRVVDAGQRERVRFRDARSAGERAREGVLQAVFDALAGGDGDTVGSGPSGYVCLADGRTIGALGVGRLPFPAAPKAPSRIGALAGRLVPARALRAVQALAAPRGWLLRFEELPAADPLLIIGASLFMVEISRW